MATGELAAQVIAGNVEAAKALYEEKSDLIDLNDTDIEYADGDSTQRLKKPLIVVALEQANEEMVKFLLEKGASVKWVIMNGSS